MKERIVPAMLYLPGLCERKNQISGTVWKFEVAVLGSPSLMVLMDVKQY